MTHARPKRRRPSSRLAQGLGRWFRHCAASEQNGRAGHRSPIESNWLFRIMGMSSTLVGVTVADWTDWNVTIGLSSFRFWQTHHTNDGESGHQI